MDTSPLTETQSQHIPQPGPAPSNGPQVRSRVTVVCAECKRLKLKCDRRTPCGSCTKRDTVARCVYSPAAAEKVDLHSLNNRLIQVESQLAQFTAPGARSHNFYNHPSGPTAHSDRPLLAVGQSGSSLAISLDDITAIWLDELDLSKDILPIQPSPSYSSCPAYTASHVKAEPTPTTIPPQDFPPSADPPVHLLLPSPNTYFTSSSPVATDSPCVNPRLLIHLPFAPRRRQKLYDNVEDVLKMHPCFNFKHFKDRAEAMFKWSAELDGHDNTTLSDPTQNGASASHTAATKLETARAIFFGPSSPSSSGRTISSSRPSLSFFAAVAAAFALGTLIDREIAEEEARLDVVHGDSLTVDDSSSRPPARKKPDLLPIPNKKCKTVSKEAVCSPTVLFALSQQASSLFEKSSPYDLDFLVTMILHVLYALHDSRARVVHTLLPEVGKMINVARAMGLDTDPDEFPGKFNLFEAESRRRLWWDIFYYDLFISDYMGRSPLIVDSEHTTRLPMDVDEDVFTPACTTIPLPRSPLSLSEPNSSDFKYFGLKCRLAQLVKDIKRRSLRDSIQNDPIAHEQFTLEQAASCASEVKQWLADLPSTFRMDIELDPVPHPEHTPPSANSRESANTSPVLLAQRCELAVTAQRLIMKVYIPFLRPSYGHGNSTSYYQATVGTFTAAHAIIRSLRALCSMWKQRPDLRGRRPMPALFSFYSFSRALFDAAVACAHNVIKDPNSVWVRTAFEDVGFALEVLRDPMLNTGRGPMRGGVEGGVHEAIKIVELLQRKAEVACMGGSDTASAGTKRKHNEIEADVDQLRHGFRLPFVSVPVLSSHPSMSATEPNTAPPINSNPSAAASARHSMAPESDQPIQNANGASPAEPQSKRSPSTLFSVPTKHAADHHKGKDKDKHAKKVPYPQTGIRVRTGKEASPFTKLCSKPNTPGPVTKSADGRPSPTIRQTPSVAPSPVVEQHPPYPRPQSASFSSASQQTVVHPSAKLDGAPVDFLIPFVGSEAVQAPSQAPVPTNMDPQSVAKVPPPYVERPHSGSFASSSPASYAASSGSYSAMNSPYTGGGGFASTPSHEQPPPSSLELAASAQNYYSYDQSHPMTLVGEDLTFQLQDPASHSNGLFSYSHEKPLHPQHSHSHSHHSHPHPSLYASERHGSVSHQFGAEQQHTQSMASSQSQVWVPPLLSLPTPPPPPPPGAMSEENGFWRYDPFTS